MANEALRKAQSLFSLQDVYVREARIITSDDFDPALQLGNLGAQYRVQPLDNVEHGHLSGPDGARSNILRYMIETGLRILRAGVENSADVKAEEILGEITATFVVKYSVAQDETPSEELIAAFTDNAVHHMWPYWREFLQASTARLRLPAFVLPMRRAVAPAAPNELSASASEK